MKVIRYWLYTIVILAIMMAGCSSDSSSDNGTSSELEADFNIQTALETENTHALKFVQNSEKLDNTMSQILSLTYTSGLDLDEIQALDSMQLSQYLSDSSIEQINSVTQSKMLIETASVIDAVEQLRSIEDQIELYNSTQAQQRILGGIIAGIGALSFLEIGVNCAEQWQGNYYACYNKKMAGDCHIYNDENEIVGTVPCKDVVLANIGIGASCSMEATMKLDACKNSAVVNIITSLTKESVAVLVPSTAVPLAITSTVDSVKKTTKGVSTIIGRWKKDCEPPQKSLSRSVYREAEKEYIYVTQSSDGNLELPEGYWDITAFSEGNIRQNYECIEADEAKPLEIEVSSIDELSLSDEPPITPTEPVTPTQPDVSEIPGGFEATINIGSDQRVFRPDNLAFLIENGYPGVLAVTLYDEDPNDGDTSEEDTETLLILKFLPSLLPGETYTATLITDPNTKFSMAYTSKFIDASLMAVAGSITITSFGNEYGDTISGSFDCDMSEITSMGDIKSSGVKGNIKGTFNGVLHLHSYYD